MSSIHKEEFRHWLVILKLELSISIYIYEAENELDTLYTQLLIVMVYNIFECQNLEPRNF